MMREAAGKRDALGEAGASVEQLAEDRAPAQLLQCLHSLAGRNEALLGKSKSLSDFSTDRERKPSPASDSILTIPWNKVPGSTGPKIL